MGLGASSSSAAGGSQGIQAVSRSFQFPKCSSAGEVGLKAFALAFQSVSFFNKDVFLR